MAHRCLRQAHHWRKISWCVSLPPLCGYFFRLNLPRYGVVASWVFASVARLEIIAILGGDASAFLGIHRSSLLPTRSLPFGEEWNGGVGRVKHCKCPQYTLVLSKKYTLPMWSIPLPARAFYKTALCSFGSALFRGVLAAAHDFWVLLSTKCLNTSLYRLKLKALLCGVETRLHCVQITRQSEKSASRTFCHCDSTRCGRVTLASHSVVPARRSPEDRDV